jgi:hypothetical protein
MAYLKFFFEKNDICPLGVNNGFYRTFGELQISIF